MKKLIFILSFIAAGGSLFADDLTAVVTNTTIGSSIGEIDLSVTGGIAPYTYSWTGPGGFSATTEDLTGLSAGTYVVTVTDQYCGEAELTVVVGEDPVATDTPIPSSSLKLYPNPFDQTFNMRFSSGIQEKAKVQVVDLLGNIVFESPLEITVGENNHVITVDLPLSNSMYMIMIRGESGVLAKKELIHLSE